MEPGWVRSFVARACERVWLVVAVAAAGVAAAVAVAVAVADDEGAEPPFLNFPSPHQYAVKTTQKWPKSTARYKIGKNREKD